MSVVTRGRLEGGTYESGRSGMYMLVRLEKGLPAVGSGLLTMRRIPDGSNLWAGGVVSEGLQNMQRRR